MEEQEKEGEEKVEEEYLMDKRGVRGGGREEEWYNNL